MSAPGWLETYARVGFAAKGVVYLILGSLAWRAAAGTGGRITSPRGAVAWLGGDDLGQVTIAVLAIGLAGYAIWRLLEAFLDVNDRGRDLKGLRARTVYALSGAVYALLALDAIRLATAVPLSEDNGAAFESLVGDAATSGLGRAAGVILIVYAIDQLRDAVSGQLSERLHLSSVSREIGRWVLVLSRAGIAARAVVFIVAGLLLVGAFGAPSDPVDTDTSDSLRLLAALPYGRWTLPGIAAGLMAYGIYQVLHARYRRIELR